MSFGPAFSLLRTKVSVKIFVRHLNKLEAIMKSLKIILDLNIFL